jgi:hypothetical protein
MPQSNRDKNFTDFSHFCHCCLWSFELSVIQIYLLISSYVIDIDLVLRIYQWTKQISVLMKLHSRWKTENKPYMPKVSTFNRTLDRIKLWEREILDQREASGILMLQEFASWDVGLLRQLAGSNLFLCQHRPSRLVSKGQAPRTKGSHFIYPCKQVTEAKSKF